MKKIICLLFALVAMTNAALAQEKLKIKDDFSGARFDWNEYWEKKEGVSVELRGEGIVLTNKGNEPSVATSCNMPILLDNDGRIIDFKLTVVFDKPEVNDEDSFGMVFNVSKKNDDIVCVFCVQEGLAFIREFKNGKYEAARPQKIVLTKGKKKDVELTIEKKGRYLIFGNDGMEILKEEWSLSNRSFGICKFGKGTLTVKSVEIEQWGE